MHDCLPDPRTSHRSRAIAQRQTASRSQLERPAARALQRFGRGTECLESLEHRHHRRSQRLRFPRLPGWTDEECGAPSQPNHQQSRRGNCGFICGVFLICIAFDACIEKPKLSIKNSKPCHRERFCEGSYVGWKVRMLPTGVTFPSSTGKLAGYRKVPPSSLRSTSG